MTSYIMLPLPCLLSRLRQTVWLQTGSQKQTLPRELFLVGYLVMDTGGVANTSEKREEGGSQPVGHDLFGVTYQIPRITDIYIMIHNSSKVTVMK